jgi:hypothetical protein
MPHRARPLPPPVGEPGWRNGGAPVDDEREHFIECPTCGHMIDERESCCG